MLISWLTFFSQVSFTSNDNANQFDTADGEKNAELSAETWYRLIDDFYHVHSDLADGKEAEVVWVQVQEHFECQRYIHTWTTVGECRLALVR